MLQHRSTTRTIARPVLMNEISLQTLSEHLNLERARYKADACAHALADTSDVGLFTLVGRHGLYTRKKDRGPCAL